MITHHASYGESFSSGTVICGQEAKAFQKKIVYFFNCDVMVFPGLFSVFILLSSRILMWLFYLKTAFGYNSFKSYLLKR